MKRPQKNAASRLLLKYFERNHFVTHSMGLTTACAVLSVARTFSICPKALEMSRLGFNIILFYGNWTSTSERNTENWIDDGIIISSRLHLSWIFLILGNDILELFYIFQAGGGNVKIESRKLEWNAAPRTKMVNENYKGPTGGDKKVEKIQKKQSDLMYKQKKTHKKTQTDK